MRSEIPGDPLAIRAGAERVRLRGQVRLPQVRVTTVDGEDWTVEAVRPAATLADLRAVYLGRRTRTP